MSTNNFASSQAFYMQYSGTPTQGHEDLLHSMTSPEQQQQLPTSRVLVNPNFRRRERPAAAAAATVAIKRHSVHIPNLSDAQPPPSAASGRLNRHSVHINPRLQAALQLPGSSTGHNKIVINPRFQQQQQEAASHSSTAATSSSSSSSSSSGTVHINPNFRPSPPSSPRKQTVHVNPRFAARPLPTIPGHGAHNLTSLQEAEPVYANVNGGLPLDSRKQQDFVHSIQQQTVVALRRPASMVVAEGRPKPPAKPVRNSILLDRHHLVTVPAVSTGLTNPSQSAAAVGTIAGVSRNAPQLATPQIDRKNEKENLPSTTKKSSFLFTPLRRTAFKKIGDRKLIRIKKKSLSPGTPKPSFKRIGNKKLIRIRDSLSNNEANTAAASPLQVYEIKTKTKLVKAVKNTPSNVSKYRFSFITPLSVRKLRLAAREDSANISSRTAEGLRLSAEKSARKKVATGGGGGSSSFASRFRLDRRPKAAADVTRAVEPATRERSSSSMLKRSSQSRLKKLGSSTYHVSATKLQKVAPPKPGRGRNVSIYRPRATTLHPGIAPNKIITVQGVKYAVAENGRRLRRLSGGGAASGQSVAAAAYSASVSQDQTSPGGPSQTSPPVTAAASTGRATVAAAATTPPFTGAAVLASPPHPLASVGGSSSTSSSRLASPTKLGSRTNQRLSAASLGEGTATAAQRKVYLGGEEFDEIEPGVFTRSRHSLTRQSITQAKNRSINIILKNQNRSKQYCMFFNKFGKCTKKDKGSCPFIHDPDKIAVCKRFLQGACHKELCLLSHRAAPEKMPACKYFLEGICTRTQCPYLHVKVSASAGICADFLRGYCPNGADCSQRHVIACPEFDRTGHCTKDKCPFPHVVRATPEQAGSSSRRPAPAKPKRKSLGQTSDQNLKKSRVANRYYQDSNLDVTPEYCGALDQGGEAATSGEAAAAAAAGTTEALAEKRKRLLRKMEISVQARSRQVDEEKVIMPDPPPAPAKRQDPDDSGPYERIAGDTSDEEEEEGEGVQGASVADTTRHRAYGQLGDFISLAGYSSGEETKEDRLI